MKKQLSVIIGALAILATTNSYAETNWGTRSGSSANLSSAPSTRTRENVNYKKLENLYNEVEILMSKGVTCESSEFITWRSKKIC